MLLVIVLVTLKMLFVTAAIKLLCLLNCNEILNVLLKPVITEGYGFILRPVQKYYLFKICLKREGAF